MLRPLPPVDEVAKCRCGYELITRRRSDAPRFCLGFGLSGKGRHAAFAEDYVSRRDLRNCAKKFKQRVLCVLSPACVVCHLVVCPVEVQDS